VRDKRKLESTTGAYTNIVVGSISWNGKTAGIEASGLGRYESREGNQESGREAHHPGWPDSAWDERKIALKREKV
jgi:hypothetical protein